MDVDAKSYGELNKPQYDSSIEFIKEFIHFSEGDKVLDMGCGTGDITKYIADIVGSKGEVVGVDPDDERIKIGKENFKEVSNLHFHVGSALIGFPREGEAYYDVHITTHAFHWFPVDQKKLYIQKAYQSCICGRITRAISRRKLIHHRRSQASSLYNFLRVAREVQELDQSLDTSQYRRIRPSLCQSCCG